MNETDANHVTISASHPDGRIATLTGLASSWTITDEHGILKATFQFNRPDVRVKIKEVAQ